MFDIPVIDVIVGLIFIYLLYSLLATILQEIIATCFAFRAKVLERAIVCMLADTGQLKYQLKGLVMLFLPVRHYDPQVKKQIKKHETDNLKPALHRDNEFVWEFYCHPLVKYQADVRGKMPSYITGRTFASVVIDLLRGEEVRADEGYTHKVQDSLDNGLGKTGRRVYASDRQAFLIGDDTLSYLRSMWVDAHGDVEKFRRQLEAWFDLTMERASGWYKRHVQFVLFFIGLFLAVCFNVDTLRISGKLNKDRELTATIVKQAEAFTKAHPDLRGELEADKAANRESLAGLDSAAQAESLAKLDRVSEDNYRENRIRRDKLVKRAEQLVRSDVSKMNNLLGGWGDFSRRWERIGKREAREKQGNDESRSRYGRERERSRGPRTHFALVVFSCAGWVLTAVAISFGAPFWFDLLNKLMRVRAAVAPQEEKKTA